MKEENLKFGDEVYLDEECRETGYFLGYTNDEHYPYLITDSEEPIFFWIDYNIPEMLNRSFFGARYCRKAIFTKEERLKNIDKLIKWIIENQYEEHKKYKRFASTFDENDNKDEKIKSMEHEMVEAITTNIMSAIEFMLKRFGI